MAEPYGLPFFDHHPCPAYPEAMGAVSSILLKPDLVSLRDDVGRLRHLARANDLGTLEYILEDAEIELARQQRCRDEAALNLPDHQQYRLVAWPPTR